MVVVIMFIQSSKRQHHFVVSTHRPGWLGSQVVSVLDSGAEGPGFKSQSRRCRVTVLGKLFTPTVPLFTHTHPFNSPFSGLPGWAGTRKVKPVWILLKQETESGSGISWAYASLHLAPDSSTPAPHHSVFYRPDALPAAQPTASKH